MIDLTFPIYFGQSRQPETEALLQAWLARDTLNPFGVSVEYVLDTTMPLQTAKLAYWHFEDILENATLSRIPKEHRSASAELGGTVISDSFVNAIGHAFLSKKSVPAKREIWECILVDGGAIFVRTNVMPWANGKDKADEAGFKKAMSGTYFALAMNGQSAHERVASIEAMSSAIRTVIKGRHDFFERATRSGISLPDFSLSLTPRDASDL